MIVAPVVTRQNKEGLAPVSVWLPGGKWTDFFTGQVFEGNHTYELFVPLDRIPVFVKEGGIVPLLADYRNNDQEFRSLEVCLYAGNGKYRLEDEAGGIDFSMQKTEDGIEIFVTKEETCPTEKLAIRVIGASDTVYHVHGNMEYSIQI